MKSFMREGDVAEIRERMSELTASDHRLWGLMTLEEMLVHVREAYRIAVGEDDLVSVPPPLPLPAGVVKVMALKLPVRWPKTIQTVPALKREALPRHGGFGEERSATLGALDAFAACRDNCRRHPIFGVMKPGDWMRWGYLHADHHLRQFGR